MSRGWTRLFLLVLGNRMRCNRLKLEQKVPPELEEEVLYCVPVFGHMQAAREVTESPSQEILKIHLDAIQMKEF